MKKNSLIIRICLSIMFCVCMISVNTPAREIAAADPENVFCVSVSNCIPGNNYILLLVKPGTASRSITAGDILFIDQYSAGTDSKLEIALIYPDFEACDAYVSGIFSNNASSPNT